MSTQNFSWRNKKKSAISGDRWDLSSFAVVTGSCVRSE